MPPLRKGVKILRENGITAFGYNALRYFDIWLPTWNTVTSRYPIGTNVFSRDWDLLIILDTCRLDVLRSLSEQYTFLSDITELRSVGSMSAEWMLNTFTEKYRESIKETAFVAGNIWAHRVLEEKFHQHKNHGYDMIDKGYPSWDTVKSDDFAHFESVTPVHHENNTLHPELRGGGHIPHIRTDRAIAVGREKSFDRMIVHYSLPHLSFISDALDWGTNNPSINKLMNGRPEAVRELRPEEKSYAPASQGKVTTETVRKLYTKNLQLVLEYVRILLQNIDANRVVISADHGEGFGEKGVWGHPFGCPFSPVKTVPWAVTTATDEETYEPKYEMVDGTLGEQERTEFLKEMGYM